MMMNGAVRTTGGEAVTLSGGMIRSKVARNGNTATSRLGQAGKAAAIAKEKVGRMEKGREKEKKRTLVGKHDGWSTRAGKAAI